MFQPDQWKCQPTKWLTPENERHKFIMGSVNMAMGGTVSGVVATYVLNGGEYCGASVCAMCTLCLYADI